MNVASPFAFPSIPEQGDPSPARGPLRAMSRPEQVALWLYAHGRILGERDGLGNLDQPCTAGTVPATLNLACPNDARTSGDLGPFTWLWSPSSARLMAVSAPDRGKIPGITGGASDWTLFLRPNEWESVNTAAGSPLSDPLMPGGSGGTGGGGGGARLGAAPMAGEFLYIVPAGDSITADPGWRTTLRARMAGPADPAWSDRPPMVTIGESSDLAGSYIGRSGKRVETLLDPILAQLALYASSAHAPPAAAPPVGVVLLGGTNNLTGATDATAQSFAADALKNWSAVAGKVLDGGAALIGVTIPPMPRSSGELAASSAFNTGLRVLLQRLASLGAPVTLADPEAVLRGSGMIGPDGVHPTAAGQAAIGAEVYRSLWNYHHGRPVSGVPPLGLPTLPSVPGLPGLGLPPFTSGPGSGPPAGGGGVVAPGSVNAQTGSVASAGFLLGLLGIAWVLLARGGR